ncbi:MAG: hypothetical protein HUU34_01455 [Saprospiraceae bacterium]|nr:hypothetical protein [Saprospiraceae bacterium]
MQQTDQVFQEMVNRAQSWEKVGDRRYIFLRCYSMMSANMPVAIQEGRFAHPSWVATLMLRFADYYFDALAQYDQNPAHAPAVWRQAHDAAKAQGTHVMQNLLLGVNAHINYDLPLALYDCLRSDWAGLDETQKRLRQNDHETVNQIIGDTIDAVQDTVVEPLSPAMALVDRLMGRMDEWLLSQLITAWRHDVWNVALQLLAASDESQRHQIKKEQESRVLERGERLCDP